MVAVTKYITYDFELVLKLLDETPRALFAKSAVISFCYNNTLK